MQQNTKIGISRRKVLAGLGTIGLASAGAGLGTSAYFSDEERFEDNVLRAGSLDLKVDWEEHYSNWSDDEAAAVSDIQMVENQNPNNVTTGYVGLPDPQHPLIAIPFDELGDFMDATALEAFPDPDNDGIQVDRSDGSEFQYVPCNMGADMSKDLDPTLADSLRTENDDTVIIDPQSDERSPAPLINLKDVKPGDFGELTLSFHLCDNPGYVWVKAENVSESENTRTEPEMEVDESPNEGELAEHIRTVWWYDARGDNVVQSDCDEKLYLIENVGSGNAGDEQTPDSDNGPFIFEVTLTGGNAELTDLTDVPDEISAGHIAATPDGQFIYVIDRDDGHLARYDVDAGTFSTSNQVVDHPGGVVLIAFAPDGTLYMASNLTDKLYSIDDPATNPTAIEVGDTGIDVQGADIAFTSDGTLFIYSNAEGSGTLFTVDTANGSATAIGETGVQLTGLAVRDAGTGDLVGSATNPDDEIIVFDKSDGSIQDRFDLMRNGSPYSYDFGDMTVGQLCGEVFHRGILADDLATLESSPVPLDGNRETGFDEFTDSGNDVDRECFQSGITHYVGFAWWLPPDVGNVIQTDSVSFDLGFYTEQCRHNDGSGLGD